VAGGERLLQTTMPQLAKLPRRARIAEAIRYSLKLTRGAREPGPSPGGGVAGHHDIDVAALLEVPIEHGFAGRATSCPWHLGEPGVLHKSSWWHVILSY
jgi:hypothetical protein